MMAVDLHTDAVDKSSLLLLHPCQFLPETKGQEDFTVTFPPSRDELNHPYTKYSSSPTLKPQQVQVIPKEFGIGSNTMGPLPQMPHSLLQDHDRFDFSRIGSLNFESSWDSMGSPQSTVWSPLGSTLGSPEGEGSSTREPSPTGNSRDSCWETTYDVFGMFNKMRIDDETENSFSKYNHPHGTHTPHTLDTSKSNVGPRSHQSLIQQQIRAIQLSRLKQEQIIALKQKLAAYRESESEFNKQNHNNIVELQKKGFGSNGRRTCLSRPPPLQQQPCSEMQQQQELFLGASHSRASSSGTGVFLPRGRTTAPSQSPKKSGKGCSNILIPARVVQALQLHFDQMAATSGPKAGGFPPLHDVLVSNKDGMYSLQKHQSRKAPANTQNEMILPQEWTY